MPTPTPIQRIRAEINLWDRTARFTDIYGKPLSCWRGTKLQIEVAFFFGSGPSKTLLTDLTDIASVTCGAKLASDKTGGYYLPAKTVSPSALTLVDWNTGDPTKAHAIFNYTDSETNIGTVGTDDTFWLVISGLDNSGLAETFGASLLTVYEDGAGGNLVANTNGRMRCTLPLQLQWPDGKWRTILPIFTPEGIPTIAVSDTYET